MEELLGRMAILLPGDSAEPALARELLRQAEEQLLHYTGRASLPAGLRGAQVRLAVMHYNRLGTEGERARHEGGLTLHWQEALAAMAPQLKPWRLGRLP